MLTIFTIGHSNRSLEAFIAVLETARINTLVDIRAYPTSTRHPHFDSKPLRETLDVHNIIYHWAGRQLGGYRKPALSSIHSSLTNSSMRAFADHMDTDVFQQGASQLIKLTRTSNICLMCAERMPSDCHRRLIADYLLLQNIRVVHLLQADQQEEHLLHPGARRESAHLVYDRQTQSELLIK